MSEISEIKLDELPTLNRYFKVYDSEHLINVLDVIRDEVPGAFKGSYHQVAMDVGLEARKRGYEEVNQLVSKWSEDLDTIVKLQRDYGIQRVRWVN